MTGVEVLYQRPGVTVLRLVSCLRCKGSRRNGNWPCFECCCQTCGQPCEYPPECRECAAEDEAAAKRRADT